MAFSNLLPQGACLSGRGILISMAILRKIKKEETDKDAPTQGRSPDQSVGKSKPAHFGLVPHITEKATFLGEKNAYVFKIKPEFNKIMVRQAVKKQYNVEPTKVRIINIPGKMVFIRRRRAQKAGYKKAVVYLKKGDKISL